MSILREGFGGAVQQDPWDPATPGGTEIFTPIEEVVLAPRL